MYATAQPPKRLRFTLRVIVKVQVISPNGVDGGPSVMQSPRVAR